MRRQMALLTQKPYVKVGFPERAFSKKRQEVKSQAALAKELGFKKKEIESLGLAKGLTVGEIAVINEFGTADGHIPERSFIRSAFDRNHKAYTEATETLRLKILLGRVTVKKALGLLGLIMGTDIKRKITEGGDPFVDNAQSTKDRKESSSPLMDTGQMRASVTHVVIGAD